MKVEHTLKPIYDNDSIVLILGSMPSVKSRELGFYYAHPQNRFWKILAKVFEEEIGKSNEEREEFLHRNHIALFDVIKTCDIEGSSDLSIKNPIANDLRPILDNSKIKYIFTTGRKAFDLYNKYILPKIGIEAIYLPSTSGANASIGMDKLYNEYLQIKKLVNWHFYV